MNGLLIVTMILLVSILIANIIMLVQVCKTLAVTRKLINRETWWTFRCSSCKYKEKYLEKIMPFVRERK